MAESSWHQKVVGSVMLGVMPLVELMRRAESSRHWRLGGWESLVRLCIVIQLVVCHDLQLSSAACWTFRPSDFTFCRWLSL